MERLVSRDRCTWMLVTATLVMIFCTGCVQRRLNIRSQPEGAFVTIDDTPIGFTPLAAPFVYGGSREIKLEKDGYKTVKVLERVRPPLYPFFHVHFA